MSVTPFHPGRYNDAGTVSTEVHKYADIRHEALHQEAGKPAYSVSFQEWNAIYFLCFL